MQRRWYHHFMPDFEVLARLEAIERKQDLIIDNQEEIMATFQDLQDALTSIGGKVSTVKTDVETLIAKLAAVPPAGLTPEQQTALDSAVTTAQGIATSLGAIDAEVNPPAPPATPPA